MKITFTWDDGAKEDIRLFELHQQYNIPGMFFVPTENSEGRAVLSEGEIREAASELISFGGHTFHHVYLTNIPKEQIAEEIRTNKEYLEDILGNEVPHFCLPGGKYDEAILQAVYQCFKTCRTAETMNFVNEGNLIRPTFHVYPRGKKSLIVNALRHGNVKEGARVALNMRESYFEVIERLIREKKETDAQIVIWGHSWELEEQGLWGKVDSLMKMIGSEYRDHIVSYKELFKE